MNNELRDRVISYFRLTDEQQAAARERERDVVVTAGAGSGKTRTLVARYVSLLADGYSPRAVVAVTFTEKAALEMRSRVRQAINDLSFVATTEFERQKWLSLNAEMDSARIGTIHSLCSEILRAHPAEARIDPKFEVIDEGSAAALQVKLIEDTLTVIVGMPEFAPLFEIFEARQLSELLAFLLKRRLDAQEAFGKNIPGSQIIQQAIQTGMQHPGISRCIEELRSMGKARLLQDAGDKLATQVEELLALWNDAEKAFAEEDLVGCAGFLFMARREKMGGRSGSKNSLAKEIVAELKIAYDELLNPITGGKESKDAPPSEENEDLFAQVSGLIRLAFEILSNSYKEALQQRRSIDFDDLEYGAAQLLQRPEIQLRWQQEIAGLLVDEFQDTNERQRFIVEAVSGAPGRLFVVGDARQSIYRFRRADVTVFRSIQQRIKAQGGLVIDLDRTYRAHEPLLDATGDILSDLMGTEEDPERPYYVPFTPLQPNRKTAPEHLSMPHIELVLGAGEDAETARPLAARALATRLLELKGEKQICTWDDVTLLLRASTGFAPYENAFEDAGIPFVTVAGQGFYNRPEIRDVINLLRALADPADDQAMAGLLRSPAFGLTDAALYQLRWQSTDPIPYWLALQGDLSGLDPADQARALRTLGILKDLLPQVDRIPVYELLKKLVDATDYRAILAIDDRGSGGRLWRNLDKLLADAESSRQINVRDFLDYLAAINDAGVREGEAPADAQGSVRIMTIHKSKGLEFPIVVLADASRTSVSRSESVYLSPTLGFAVKLDPAPMLYRLAKWQDQLQDEAETKRVLYVALTRAKDKLLISGHTTQTTKGEWTAKGWMEGLCSAANVDIQLLVDPESKVLETQTGSGHPIRAFLMATDAKGAVQEKPGETVFPQEPEMEPLFPSLVIPSLEPISEDEPTEIHPWRAVGSDQSVPPNVIGQMVHKAIALWLFPEDPRLIPLLESEALGAGLAFRSQRQAAIRHASVLLARLKNHPVYQEIQEASEHFHELPYSRMVNNHPETGYIDLLYRSPSGWQIIDFKTDSIQNVAERNELSRKYSSQMQRYASAVEILLGQKTQTRICFLDDQGRLELVTVC